MKKILTIGALIALLCIGVVMANYCYESDSGDDPLNFGTLYANFGFGDFTKSDFCYVPGQGTTNECFRDAETNCRLMEYFCAGNDSFNTRSYSVSHCLNGEAV